MRAESSVMVYVKVYLCTRPLLSSLYVESAGGWWLVAGGLLPTLMTRETRAGEQQHQQWPGTATSQHTMQNAATVRLQQTALTVIVFCTPQIDLTREIAGRGLGPMQLHYSPSLSNHQYQQVSRGNGENCTWLGEYDQFQ